MSSSIVPSGPTRKDRRDRQPYISFPVQINLCTPQLAFSAPVQNKATRTESRQPTVEELPKPVCFKIDRLWEQLD